MANTKITSRVLADDAVLTANITDANVTTAKIAADAITGAKIADDAINSEHYTDGSIDTAHIADANVTTAKIADDAITTAKIADDVALGGNPTTTTQSAGNNTTRIATTAFVTTALSSISSDSLSDADSDTKIQVEESSDEDKIRFDTGGTERVIIDATGVGIGTSSPAFTFDLQKSLSESYSASARPTALARVLNTNTADNNHATIEFGTEPSSGNGGVGFIGSTVTGSNLADLFFGSRTGASSFATHMTIKSDGNVGIGTDGPVADVELRKSKSSTSKLLVRNTSSNDAADAAVGFLTQGNVDFTVGIDQSAGSLFKISKHETLGNNDALIINSDSHVSISAAKRLYLDGLGDTYISEYSANEVEIQTGGARRFSLSGGNGYFTGSVGINTTSLISNAKLTVDGGDMMVHGANNSAGISDLLAGYTRGDYGTFYSTANHIYFVVGSSYVGYISGSSGQYNVSDERLKENVATLTGTLDKVKQLRGVSYTWKDTEEKGTDTNIGMIAQEVETVYPELVGDGGLPNDNAGNAPYKSINYAHLTSVLVEAVKELSTKLEAAEARIKTLEDA